MSSSPHENEPQYGRRLDPSGEGPPQQPDQVPYGQGPYGQGSYSRDSYAQGPYGQNPYSQQGHTQQGDSSQGPYGGYGGPSGSPYGGGHAGGIPSGWHPQGPGQAEAPKRPWTLLTSLFLVIGAGLMLVIAGALTMSSVQQSTPEELMADPDSFSGAFWEGFLAEAPPADHQELITVFGVMALIFAIVGFFVYLTIAFVGSFAGNPGRIIATVVLGLGLVGNLLSLFPYGGWMLLVAALSLAAIVMYWLPPTNTFIRRRRELKQGGAGAYPAASFSPGYGPTHPG